MKLVISDSTARGLRMTGGRIERGRNSALTRALQYIIEAIDLIDASEGPPQVAAQLDLARHDLSSWLTENASRVGRL